jgi:ribosomal protein S18 acetylase RimI-like enzyme
MTASTFTLADPIAHRDALVSINIEYLSWVWSEIEQSFDISVQELVGMPVAEYVSSVIDKVCGDPPPRGAFYLIAVDGKLAGMGGLRCIRDGVGEIKRVYVRPAYRGLHLGEAILRRLLSDARDFGYQSMCLDSAPFMQSAQRLYRAAGFTDCAPYEGAEVPVALHANWCFMERAL